ncbi:MAG: hypothetical protein GX065_05315, partial [Firmicutes bacterium]|nr:hypothetical protein [Bacillota bacterium]
MVRRLFAVTLVLAMLMVSGLRAAGGTNSWDELDWQDFPSEVPGRVGYNHHGGTIPER